MAAASSVTWSLAPGDLGAGEGTGREAMRKMIFRCEGYELLRSEAILEVDMANHWENSSAWSGMELGGVLRVFADCCVHVMR